MNIFQVKSNINHNGENLTIGQVIEGEMAEFGHLIQSGALRLLEEATSIEHAIKIIAQENTDAKAQAEASVPAEEQNTWGPKKDEEPVDANAVDATEKTTADQESTQENKPEETKDDGITGEEL